VSDERAIVREPLLSADLAEDPTIERVHVARIQLSAAQATGLHFHPCDVIGYVTSGTIRFQVAGQEETTLRAGDAFFEPANQEIAHFDNASADEPAAFIACYLLPPGEERLIEMLQPAD
jgi:quercetin dioxygenase-like cupin family protein